jgi:hypothetical protein
MRSGFINEGAELSYCNEEKGKGKGEERETQLDFGHKASYIEMHPLASPSCFAMANVGQFFPTRPCGRWSAQEVGDEITVASVW